MKKYKFILSGGGTGGHIYPAISIAEKLLEVFPTSDITFVGSIGGMEMKTIPKYGYKIKGLLLYIKSLLGFMLSSDFFVLSGSIEILSKE